MSQVTNNQYSVQHVHSDASTGSLHHVPAVMAMKANLPSRLFDSALNDQLMTLTGINVNSPVISDFSAPEFASQLHDAHCLIYGWGAPKVTVDALNRMPHLKAVVASQGSAWRDFTPDALDVARKRGIVGTNVQQANALPVAEYCLGVILLGLKDFALSARMYRASRSALDRENIFPHAGTYHKTVGLVTANGTVARDLIRLLKPFDLHVIGWSIDMDEDQARTLGIERVSLDEVFSRSDVVSIHTPSIPATRNMITAHHLSLMKKGALLLNSARGAVIDHDALEKELVSGHIRAVLDVTDPHEPLEPGDPLWNLPNVILTPHIAGSLGCELHRLGANVIANISALAHGHMPEQCEPIPSRTK